MPIPPLNVQRHAAIGLEMRRALHRGGTAVGIARARDLSNGVNVSLRTIHRMYSFFSRHAVDKRAQGFYENEPGYPSNGRIAWELWGGDPGFEWSKKILHHNPPRKHWDDLEIGSEYDDVELQLRDPLFYQDVRYRRNPVNIKTVLAALKSPKTPANLKKGLIRKYGHLLQGVKLPMSALASTVHVNPKKKKFDGNFGKGYIGNPKGNTADVYVTTVGRVIYIDYPAKQYTGSFPNTIAGKKRLKSFLKPAVDMGLSISYNK